jgi:hypothetical protein
MIVFKIVSHLIVAHFFMFMGFLTFILCFQVRVQPTLPMFQLDICLHYFIREELNLEEI